MSSSDTSTISPKRNVLFSVLQSVSRKYTAISRIKLLNVSCKMSYFITGFYNQYSTLLYSSSMAFPVAAPCPGTITPPTQSTPITSRTAFLLCVPCLCGFSCVLSHLNTLRYLLLAFSDISLSTSKQDYRAS